MPSHKRSAPVTPTRKRKRLEKRYICKCCLAEERKLLRHVLAGERDVVLLHLGHLNEIQEALNKINARINNM